MYLLSQATGPILLFLVESPEFPPSRYQQIPMTPMTLLRSVTIVDDVPKTTNVNMQRRQENNKNKRTLTLLPDCAAVPLHSHFSSFLHSSITSHFSVLLLKTMPIFTYHSNPPSDMNGKT
ncbi:hypothetical protein N7497_004568 [Penicillium chrysogenum]|uniref:Uncharacterized protein n=1 Tax=Penicillium chrysogenum TaxID=5076 RepID=A0ABQ8WBE8_PENCH|nr:hypothetical protein N7505_008967 [Penicillium chrysogenum]KAJ6160031.1 hypothetical protein N7497_004568 [Penicillium chrysogenum]